MDEEGWGAGNALAALDGARGGKGFDWTAANLEQEVGGSRGRDGRVQ